MIKTIVLHPETLAQIEAAPIPGVVNPHMRHLTRKEWAEAIRSLFKSMGIKNISVTTPSYSMAQAVDIHLPDFWEWEGEHKHRHEEIDTQERNNPVWNGYGTSCNFCRREWEAKQKIKSIVLAAFPDLDDRSDTQSDYFDYCISVD
jgi:hypothetical protein